jgi:hypothetical protein
VGGSVGGQAPVKSPDLRRQYCPPPPGHTVTVECSSYFSITHTTHTFSSIWASYLSSNRIGATFTRVLLTSAIAGRPPVYYARPESDHCHVAS